MLGHRNPFTWGSGCLELKRRVKNRTSTVLWCCNYKQKAVSLLVYILCIGYNSSPKWQLTYWKGTITTYNCLQLYVDCWQMLPIVVQIVCCGLWQYLWLDTHVVLCSPGVECNNNCGTSCGTFGHIASIGQQAILMYQFQTSFNKPMQTNWFFPCSTIHYHANWCLK